MDFAARKLILCTTIYKGMEPYLREWYASLLRQTDQKFELWVALDGLSIEQINQAMGDTPEAIWVHAEAGETPAAVRQRVLAPITAECDGVVLVDSDDIMHPERVAAARAGLKQYDMVACALRLVDQHGADLGTTFDLPAHTVPDAVLPQHNVFGLSNTAWRANLLQRCLPIPADVEIVDWFLATRAWLVGARSSFDPVVGMDYRQHDRNMVRVCSPFYSEQVIRDTKRVCHHFELVRNAPPDGVIASRLGQIARVANDVERFAARVIPYPELLDKYVCELNELDLPPVWWSSVAHPSLKQMWTD